MEMTKQKFWEDFWADIKLPVKVNLAFSNDRNIANVMLQFLPCDSSFKAIEIGCAPGKWLVFLHERFRYKIEGCEYLTAAYKQTIKNLEILGVKDYKIYCCDFLNDNLSLPKYDVVLSLGFVEHFDNSEKIIKKQLNILKPNSFLVVGIPKFTGINYYIQKIIDRKKGTNAILKTHNLSIMNKKYFQKMAFKHNLNILFCNYVGGFEPALFDLKNCCKIFKVFFRLVKIIFDNPLGRRLNCGFYSGYIMAIYKKL